MKFSERKFNSPNIYEERRTCIVSSKSRLKSCIKLDTFNYQTTLEVLTTEANYNLTIQQYIITVKYPPLTHCKPNIMQDFGLSKLKIGKGLYGFC